MNEKAPAWFAKAMAIIAETFGKKLDDEMTLVYWRVLRDIPEEKLKESFGACLKREKFFPVPATLRELAGSAGGNLAPDQRALLAWHGVLKTMSKHGAWDSVNFGPLVNRVIESMGGWPYLCSLESEELRKWRAKEFVDLFLSYERAGVGGGPASLPGLHEQGNRERGFITAIPEVINVKLLGVKDQPVIEPAKLKELKS